jgi:uncharacterized membrane protein YhiD involved in acid resistance
LDTIGTLQQYLTESYVEVSYGWFIISIAFVGIEAYFLKLIYVNFGNTLSNREQFGRTFPLIAMTTMLIITVVKSSLALSLGLVGALSIIRFRAAIKEPEELAYLFIAISIGLGFGANQGVITSIAILIIILALLITRNKARSVDNENLFLTIISDKPKDIDSKKIILILEKYSSSLDLKRLEESNTKIELSFLIELIDSKDLLSCKDEILALEENIICTFLDNNKIY